MNAPSQSLQVNLHQLLRAVVEKGASDLHITTGSPPQLRIDGSLLPLKTAPLTPVDTKHLCYSVLSEEQKITFERKNEIDLSFGVKGLARFRANLFVQRGAVSGVFRQIPFKIMGFDELGRQDPDVILIGELRDLETIEAALTISETGHLVFGTLHTNSAVQSINRIIDAFPSHHQSQIRAQLSFVLQGVCTQQLVPNADGPGRSLAIEVMIPNVAIRNLIREDKVHQIYSVMQTGQSMSGMQTMNQSLFNLYTRRLITRDEAIGRSQEPDELEAMMRHAAR